MFYFTVRTLTNLVLHVMMRREYVGLENFPASPPYILVTNHLSAFDTPMVLTACPHQVRAFAASKHKGHPFYGPLLEHMGSIWVERGEVDRRALREALALLENGGVLGLAPEGTRARGEYALQEGKAGAAYLAARAEVPIVPVGITGTEKVKDEFPRLRRAHVKIVVGEPFQLPHNGRIRGPQLQACTDFIMEKIAALLPESYRGVYA